MSIQLFQSPGSDLSVTSFPQNQVGAYASEPIVAADDVLVWSRSCFLIRPARSPKSHETAPTKSVLLRIFSWIFSREGWQSLKLAHHSSAQSKGRCGRNFVLALSCIAVLTCLASIASAQPLRIEIRVLPDA